MPNKKMNYRSASIREAEPGGPATFDPDTRSVEVVGATDAPALVFDWARLEMVDEILLMDGLELPKSRQVPVLDSHSRDGASSVLGSYREMKTDKNQLTGRVFFSSVAEAESPMTKVKEGHMTDFSAGYRVIESEWVPKGETTKIKGRSFSGPVSVVTRWRIKELSLVPIGADENATARSQPKENHKEKKVMNEAFRKQLEELGLPVTATEDEAYAFARERMRPIPPKNPPPDPDAIRIEAEKKERSRVSEIEAMCRLYQFPGMASDLIREGTPMDSAREAVLKAVNAREAEKELSRKYHISLGIDETDRFRQAATDGMLLRSGMKVEKPSSGALDLRGFTLVEMARLCLEKAGKRPFGNVMEMVGRALTTSDLPYLLANVANKALFDGWEMAEETWSIWCGVGSVSDFKTQYSPRVSEASDLAEIPESAPYTYGKLTEAQESYSILTYGKLFAVTRQAIINDDLSALTNIPRSHGESAARKIGDLAYAVLTANAAMGDGIVLFHATDHDNIGTGGVPSETTLAEAIKLMKLQKNLQTLQNLNIRPEFFIAPVTLEGSAEIFFNSNQFAGGLESATRANPYAGTRFTRIYEARLDASSTTAWYLAARRGRTVVMYFLNGVQAPYLETREGWTVDGVEYKVRIDAGAKAMDWRGLVKNAGA